MFTKDTYFAIPAYPLESVLTRRERATPSRGADGFLTSHETIDEQTMRRAMIYGSVMASFNVEEFGTERVDRLTHEEINERFSTSNA